MDIVTVDDQAFNYPIEFLNSLELSGMPPHILSLKVGPPIMMLPKLIPNVIETTINISGKNKGEDVLIPRISMIPTDLSFNFKRLQFPVPVHKDC